MSLFSLPWPLFGKEAVLLLEIVDGRLKRLRWEALPESSHPPLPRPPRTWTSPFRRYLDGETRALTSVPRDFGGLTAFRRRALETLRRLPPEALTAI